LRLEDILPNAALRGLLPDSAVIAVSVQVNGSDGLTLIYRGAGNANRAWEHIR
jgi:hypothetical protein